jgi:heme oxygenase
MSAVVLPFPLARRVDLIHRQAQRALELKPEQGIRHIELQLECQAEAMRRRGVAEHLIKRELASMEAAIQSAMWHVVFDTPGGAM